MSALHKTLCYEGHLACYRSCLSALSEPHGAAEDWHGSTLVHASHWHIAMALVCLEPPTRHTCYMCVAKNGISAPLPHIV